ncbi:MAG TPA: hypothetical protein VKE71_05935 [Candidatus Angelobacter sp.]|nr:hypothetical protein [Candidatus Angelobacter sp.]
MAITKVKRSVHPSKAVTRNDRVTSTRHLERSKLAERKTHNRSSSHYHQSKNINNWLRKVLRFPQAKGKIIESVEFSTELGYHCISINFTDKTSLNFEVEARFLVETDYSDWKTGNQRLLRRWRPVHNLEFRDTL